MSFSLQPQMANLGKLCQLKTSKIKLCMNQELLTHLEKKSFSQEKMKLFTT